MKISDRQHITKSPVFNTQKLKSKSFISPTNTFLFKVHMAMPGPGC